MKCQNTPQIDSSLSEINVGSGKTRHFEQCGPIKDFKIVNDHLTK